MARKRRLPHRRWPLVLEGKLEVCTLPFAW
jgi:hypothetical protein